MADTAMRVVNGRELYLINGEWIDLGSSDGVLKGENFNVPLTDSLLANTSELIQTVTSPIRNVADAVGEGAMFTSDFAKTLATIAVASAVIYTLFTFNKLGVLKV